MWRLTPKKLYICVYRLITRVPECRLYNCGETICVVFGPCEQLSEKPFRLKSKRRVKTLIIDLARLNERKCIIYQVNLHGCIISVDIIIAARWSNYSLSWIKLLCNGSHKIELESYDNHIRKASNSRDNSSLIYRTRKYQKGNRCI